MPASPARSLRAAALAYPNVSEEIACKGTALECASFKAGKKAFLFISSDHARLKLDASQKDAKKAGCDVGAQGWAKVPFSAGIPVELIQRWIEESFQLVVEAKPKKKRAAN